MILTLIAAMDRNRVIGRDADLPWRLRDDMRHFMRTTRGWPVIMGRRTWETMPGGEPLKGRHNIVITRQEGYEAAGASVVRTMEEAIQLAAGDTGLEDPVFVIGGGEIYGLAIGAADRMILTHIEAAVEGDVHFPEWDMGEWHITDEWSHAADDENEFAFAVRTYDRG